MKLRWYKFPERHKLSTLIQEETVNLKSHVSIRGTQGFGKKHFYIENFQSDDFTDEFYQTLKEEKYQQY